MSSSELADELLKKPYARVMVPQEAGGFHAEMLEFPGCFACGDTLDEAYAALERAAHSWLVAVLDSGQSVPSPRASY